MDADDSSLIHKTRKPAMTLPTRWSTESEILSDTRFIDLPSTSPEQLDNSQEQPRSFPTSATNCSGWRLPKITHRTTPAGRMLLARRKSWGTWMKNRRVQQRLRLSFLKHRWNKDLSRFCYLQLCILRLQSWTPAHVSGTI